MKIHDRKNTIWACIALVVFGLLMLFYGDDIRYYGFGFIALATGIFGYEVYKGRKQ